MADNRNMALSDELFADVSGGFGVANRQKIYDAVGTVIMLLKDGSYMVRFDDGGEVTASSKDGKSIAEGAKVGLFAVAGGWIMDALDDER